jgi:hypothetical protein|tara:strand:- start:229 stop:1653 length:1425 start_codon:yes stop_codon:yes gene_type:complete
MNKKIIMPIALLTLISLVVFVSATMDIKEEYTTGNKYEVEIHVEKGWNIISGMYDVREIMVDSEIKKEDIGAIWYYSPILRKYLNMHPNMNEDDFGDDITYFEGDDPVLTSAKWLYSKKAGLLKYSTIRFDKVNERKVVKGWNFIRITPEFLGKTLNEIKGSCNIEKAYAWDIGTQDWDDDLVISDWKFNEETIVEPGRGFVIKSLNNCIFKTSSGTTPPPLPGTGNGEENGLPHDDSEANIKRIFFQEQISSYTLDDFTYDGGDCGELNGVEVCADSARIEYFSEIEDKMIHVLPILVSKGREAYVDYLEGMAIETLSNGLMKLEERWELAWVSDNYLFMTQDYTYIKNPDGSAESSPNTADVDNVVIQHFLDKYPPVLNCEDLLPVSCDDRDGGLNYNQKDFVWGTHHVNADGVITCQESSFGEGDECCTECDFSEDGNEGVYLREGYCDEQGVVRFEKYQCPNGCQQGVCI